MREAVFRVTNTSSSIHPELLLEREHWSLAIRDPEIRARYDRSSPAVRQVARGAYDSYLRANRIEEGIANYGVVLQLLLGTRFEEGWKPRLRH